MFVPIPPAFHSDYAGRPFDRCNICEADLTVPGTTHVVLKYQHTRSDRGPETIVEFAACTPCLQSHAPAPSEASLDAIAKFRSERMNGRPLLVMPPDDGVPTHCETCGTDLGACRTFSMRAEIETDEDGMMQMSLRPSLAWISGSPVMMCDQCNGQLAERISASTRDSWDKFYDRFVNTPPAIEFDDSPRPVLV